LAAAIVAAKVVYVWAALSRGISTTFVGDVVTVIGLGAIAVAMARYLRALAAEADLARRLAAEEESRRASAVFHNGVAVLGLLAESGLDPTTRTALREQARDEVQRVRAYMRGEPRSFGLGPDATLTGAPLLADVIRRAARTFPDLRPELMLDLVPDVRVSAEQAAPLEAAMTSLLLNVRSHARATSTVLHADVEEGVWTVTVHDDGVGFDLTSVALGVGLGHVVVDVCSAHGIRAVVDSVVGLGTTVTLSGGTAP